jgi:hypothetical protein
MSSSSDRLPNGRHIATAITPAAPAAPADPYANWLDRVQRARGRHAAITRNLYTWSNYKSWAERVKDSWDEEKKK